MESVVCTLCHQNQSSPYYLRVKEAWLGQEEFSLVKCQACGLVYTNPRPTEQEIRRYYSTEFYGRGDRRFNPLIDWLITLTRRKRAKDIMKLRRPGVLLDVGCGNGSFLVNLKEQGWTVYGTELSTYAIARVSSEFRQHIFIGPVSEAKYPKEFFDVITLWHVFEHLPDPSNVLEELWRILKPGGLLVISGPNLESLQAKFGQEHWFHLFVPHHYYHYSPAILQTIVERAGFRTEKWSAFDPEQNIFGFVQTFFNRMGLHHNLLLDRLKSKSNRDGRSTSFRVRGQIALMYSLLPAVLCIGLVFSAFGWMSNNNGTMVMYAHKEKDRS
ncbi:class I SAM-dependent methyltransferase [Nitrospinae bacterium AH_259_B05_G02_I21]|nr:class I SAM-dependent methyltransferase [Nitrospinae bacterium AH_259_B05_G02_I21]MDA2931645.1 class I SAM-dependent methyltransferase [Nitrospinae bacterium AH-259-F20]